MIETTNSQTLIARPAPRSALQAAAVPAVRKERLLYIDTLRLVMIVLVVLQHAAVTYSGMGSWYYKEETQLGALSFILFGFFEAINQGYFMGILFLAAGYFVPPAYDQKGFTRFLKDRFIRLGIPSLLYMLVINPFIWYVLLGAPGLNPKPGLWQFYSGYITQLHFLSGSGPLWFALALLIFSFVYAFVRWLTRNPSLIAAAAEMKINSLHLLGLTLVIAILTFLIRLVQPVGTSVMNMQLCNFAQCIILFVVGIQAFRRNWLKGIETGLGMRWLRTGWGLIPGLLMLIIVMGDAIKNGTDLYNGGWHWQSTAYALWESYTAVCLSVGLLTLFREKYNSQSRLVKILSDNSFAVYVFHAPVLIAISLLLQPLSFIPLAKFAIVGLLAVAASYLLAYLVLRRVPLLKKVL